MIKEFNFQNACKEVYTILKYIDENDLRKIPQDFIEIIEANMNKLYEFEYNPDIELDKQDILKETKIIFAYIFLNFWATDKQAQIIKVQFEKDIIIAEENKRKQYNPSDIFKKKEIESNEEVNKLAIIVENENIIKKILKKIMKFIKKSY